jgi:hypothetical protein
MITFRLIGLVAFTAALAACAKDSLLAPGAPLAHGTWGANDVQVIASDSATLVRVGCDDGQFTGHITLDANGQFIANGTWTQAFQAYFYFPITVPAQMSGQVSGTTLTFAIAAANTGGQPAISTGPRTVVLGAAPTFGGCGV